MSKSLTALRRLGVSWRTVALVSVMILAFIDRLPVPMGTLAVRAEYLAAAAVLIVLLLGNRLPAVPRMPGWQYLATWLALNLAASAFVSPQPVVSLQSAAILLLNAALMALVAAIGSRYPQRTTAIYLTVWTSAVAAGVVGYGVDVVAGTGLATDVLTDLVVYRRAFGTFWEPNFFGISSMMLGVVSWSDVLSGRRGAVRQAGLVRLVLSTIAVFLSGTRSAQITFVVGLALSLVFRRRISRAALCRAGLVTALGIALLSLVLSGVIPSRSIERLVRSVEDPMGSSSLSGRLRIYERALVQMEGHWWLGHGTNSFKLVNAPGVVPGRSPRTQPTGFIASLPLTLLYDTGASGALVALIWLASHHLVCARAAREIPLGVRVAPFGLASFLMFSAYAMSDGTLLAFTWVHLGVTVAQMRDPGAASWRHGQTPPPVKVRAAWGEPTPGVGVASMEESSPSGTPL